MGVEEKNCVPCQVGAAVMGVDEAKKMLEPLHHWVLVEDGTRIRREFKFRNFRKALEWVNQVGELAEEQGHHPDIQLGWGYVIIDVMTHKINGLHENDFILAAKINAIGGVDE